MVKTKFAQNEKFFKAKTMRKIDRAHGFTLVELVVVIVLLGILFATALPRFVNLRGDAYESVFKSTLGTFTSAVSSAHLKWLTAGSPSVANSQNLIGTVDFNILGYPAGTDDGTNVTTSQDCMNIFTGLVDTSLVLQVINSGPDLKIYHQMLILALSLMAVVNVSTILFLSQNP